MGAGDEWRGILESTNAAAVEVLVSLEIIIIIKVKFMKKRK